MNKFFGRRPMAKFFDELMKRGLIHQVTDEGLYSNPEKLTFYCGFDPTSDSLHLGSLLPLLTMKRFQQVGYKPILLMGGGTGLIGDPSGKSQERILLSEDVIQRNVAGIEKTAMRFLNFDGPAAAVTMNNYDWFKNIQIIDFLRDTGKHFTINNMLAKDSVRSRFEDRDQGISFTEFSYMLLQGFDFYQLNKMYKCDFQIGGSDQWGNITAGIELIRRKTFSDGHQARKVFGLTMPLVTKSDGTKFGKSESGTVWLTKEKTSPYDLYQFLLRTEDHDVEKYLNYFSFKSLNEISEIIKSHKEKPEKRFAQTVLADELVDLIHGAEELESARRTTKAFFSHDYLNLTEEQFLLALNHAPIIKLPQFIFGSEISLINLLVDSKICESKAQARRDILAGALYINGNKVNTVDKKIIETDLLFKNRLVLQKGKKNYFLIEFS
jgi:tyrosyl-tRNA synthetase